MRKAIIAMSGGVDSSVAALLTKETGDECIGATMKLFHNEDIGVKREKTCCSLDDVEDARNVCYRMGIRYYVFNFSERFKEDVMDRFVDAYEHGATPNPCIDCNRYLKFDKMFQRMRELEYDYIVTGHYARVEYDEEKNRYLLKFKFETLQLHVGQEQPDPVTDARAVPIYQTSSYVFRNCDHAAARFGLADAGNIYGRLTNPTEDVFEKRIAALEGGAAALAVASGAAAITYTIENLAQQGDHIVAAKNIYGGTTNLLEHTLPAYGITTTFVDVFNLEEVENAIQDNTKAVYIETLGNPNSDVVDIEASQRSHIDIRFRLL